jgi:hypothetical protein
MPTTTDLDAPVAVELTLREVCLLMGACETEARMWDGVEMCEDEAATLRDLRDKLTSATAVVFIAQAGV